MKRFKINKHLYHTKKLLNTTLDEDITSMIIDNFFITNINF